MAPNQFNNIPGWFDFQEIYNRAVKNKPNDGTFVEIGAWKGKSTCYMAELLKYSGSNNLFFVIDTWTGSGACLEEGQRINVHGEFMRNMKDAGVLSYVHPIVGSSQDKDVSDRFEEHSCDFVFIDGDHSYDAVRDDLKLWFNKVKRGGIIAGHDYMNNETAGVKRAVDEFFPTPVQKVGSSWLYEKK